MTGFWTRTWAISASRCENEHASPCVSLDCPIILIPLSAEHQSGRLRLGGSRDGRRVRRPGEERKFVCGRCYWRWLEQSKKKSNQRGPDRAATNRCPTSGSEVVVQANTNGQGDDEVPSSLPPLSPPLTRTWLYSAFIVSIFRGLGIQSSQQQCHDYATRQ